MVIDDVRVPVSNFEDQYQHPTMLIGTAQNIAYFQRTGWLIRIKTLILCVKGETGETKGKT